MIRKERKARWVYRCSPCDYTSPASVDLFGAQEWQQRHERSAALTHAWQGLAAMVKPAIDFVQSVIGTAEQQTKADFALVPAPIREKPLALLACGETVWDGPYKMTCGYLVIHGRCVRHGSGGLTYIVPPDSTAYRSVRKAQQDG
ncbi:hypothetical protein SEA_ELESAR_60 [Arthrobacter phage Elesar]|uniref:Uncharacterized protein n=1 Tax=Arthrobacter phage Elesar TaxID=2510522 RepID=A0A411CQB2_9CAUD|nr:hypothetical protein QEO79_gp36 [Arthrobacter phage Elesar]QAY16111.1 hypothetical protein SEA_ELESAR_60 [Arthrobacter phage Elesar]